MKKDLNYKDLVNSIKPIVWTMAMVLDPNIFGSRDIIIKKMLTKELKPVMVSFQPTG